MARLPVVRPARPDDLDAVLAIQHTEPTPELIGLAGSPARARRFGRALTRSDWPPAPTRPVVMLEGATGPVAFMAYSIGPMGSGSFTPGRVVRVVGALGPGVVGLPRRLRARGAVELVVPEHSLYIAELHVHPDHRGEGLGSQLLSWSSRRCVELGLGRRSLITGAANPAVHLYTRHGFTVIATATDGGYERIVGQTGRVLMTAPPDVAAQA